MSAGRHPLLHVLHLAHHLVAHCVHHWIHSPIVRHLLLLHLHLLHVRWLLGHHHLLWRFKYIHVLGIVHVVKKVVHLHFADAALVKEILSSVQVNTHLLGLLQESLLLIHEVLGDHAWLHGVWTHGELLLDKAALLLGTWVRSDIVLAHPTEQLAWDLHQCLFRQQVRIVLEVVKGNELNDIGRHVLAVGGRVECLIVAI